LRIGLEANGGAALVGDAAELFQPALRFAARKRHAVELLAARDLDDRFYGQRVDHRHTDAMQTARGLVDLRVEFSARMQRAHDDFERGLLREFRMRVNRHAAAVVSDGDIAIGAEMHLDEGGVAGDGLVHRVVDHLREQMVERLLVGTADIHARPATDRLQALQHLDVVGGIVALGTAAPRGRGFCRSALGGLGGGGAAEQICGFLLGLFGRDAD
jgi:hypothetical protein